jgi:hypothetical protein
MIRSSVTRSPGLEMAQRSRSTRAFLIDRPKRLKIVVTPTKQTTEAVSNRMRNGGYLERGLSREIEDNRQCQK